MCPTCPTCPTWKRSFVATTVALGDTVDDALAAIGEGVGDLRAAHAGRSASHVASASFGVPDLHTPAHDADVSELVAQLRAPHRATRAAALAKAVHEIVLRIEEGTLR